MEPTSEQELKQLLEEGKITEEEYQQLLEAIHQKDKPQEPLEKLPQNKPHTRYGKAALILMIVGFLSPLLPLILNIILATTAQRGVGVRMIMITAFPFILVGLLCLLLAFIFGIIGWKTVSGKIAAIGVPCLGLLIMPGLLLLSLFCVRTSHVVVKEKPLVTHKSYPLDSTEGVLTQDGIVFDEQISSDGKGALRIQTNSPDRTVIRLFETGPLEIEGQMLFYSAQIKSDLSEGKAYLEMWCDIPGRGEFFSRGLERPVTGTTEWTTVQTPFRLETGQMPANVKLNLVIEGTGTVWIDDIKLLSSPL